MLARGSWDMSYDLNFGVGQWYAQMRYSAKFQIKWASATSTSFTTATLVQKCFVEGGLTLACWIWPKLDVQGLLGWGDMCAKFQIIWWLLACTSFTNMTDFLPIRQEFVFFMRGGRKGLRYPGSEIVHVRWSSTFEKCGGIIVKLSFGGCFTKHPLFGTRKMENGIRKWLNFYSTQMCNIWV